MKKSVSIWSLAAASLSVGAATTPIRAQENASANARANAQANAKTSARSAATRSAPMRSAATRPSATAVPSQLIAASSSAISASENGETETSGVAFSNSKAKQNASEVVESAAQRWSKPAATPRISTQNAPRVAGKTLAKTSAKPVKTAPKNSGRPVLVSSVSSETVESYIMLSRPANVAPRPDSSRTNSKRVSDTSRLEIADYSRNPKADNFATSSTRSAAKAAPTRVAPLPPTQNAQSQNASTQNAAKDAAPSLNRALAPQKAAVAESKSLEALVAAGKTSPTKTAVKTPAVQWPTVQSPAVQSPAVQIPQRKPANLSSRARDRILLAQMEVDLRRAQGRLNNANETLSRGQRQLMKVSGTLQQAMLEAGSDAKGLHPFVRVAQRYAGTPYVWGGESRNGFDCSGFIIVVMRDLGYRALPHSAAEQFNYGTPIAKPLIKPGDIVFFKNTYKRGVSHVGIAIGRGRFIHAAGTGTGTIVSSLNEPKWILHYAGARRLVRN